MSGFSDDLFDFCDDDAMRPSAFDNKTSEDVKGSSKSLGDVLREITDKTDEPIVPVPPKRQKLEEQAKFDWSLFKDRIQVHEIECPEGMQHEAVYPPAMKFKSLVPPTVRAREYKFKLDPFQNRAIMCIDNLQSVLVSAHTSAGKTVVAEYAIALGLKKNQRVLYTTPIKALSNQKFREFTEEFSDVGLMTGDVTINPNASCLIMTTEILRSMLYRGSEILREVGWVIFDEIHYMRNKERGYVWEETIILLQDEIRMVFLSATVPNARQFAEWVVSLHNQPVHVVYTEYRPVPLQHYVFPYGGRGLFLVVDEKNRFDEKRFAEAMAELRPDGDNEVSAKKTVKSKNKDVMEINRLLQMVMEHDLAPVIVFSFAKRDCELYALKAAEYDFNTEKEKELVKQIYKSAMEVLSEEDRKLKQVKEFLPALVKGVGVHHGGLLPILKETIEILFGEGLIKVLFATETFAMGLNMPARTVVFTSARKFDGHEQRWLHGAEYIQMSGRAGRRGKDDKGVVILSVDEKMDAAVGRNLVQGNPEQLTSAFQLTYNMVLNLLRVDGINPEFMLQRSFHQFQSYAMIPQVLAELKQYEEEFESITVDREEEFASYHRIQKTLAEHNANLRVLMKLPKYLVPFLNPGRLIEVQQCPGKYFGWCMVVSLKKIEPEKSKRRKMDEIVVEEPKYEVHVLLRMKKDQQPPVPAGPRDVAVNEVVAVFLPQILRVSTVKVPVPNDLTHRDSRAKVMLNIENVSRRFKGELPELSASNMNIKEPSYNSSMKAIEEFSSRLKAHPLYNTPNVDKLYQQFLAKTNARLKGLEAKKKLHEAQELIKMEELRKKKQVLQSLTYCSKEGVLDLKGRVACELSTADELLLAEMLFNGVFTDLSPANTMAVLSCMVCDENTKSKEFSGLSEELSGPLRQVQDLAKNLVKSYKSAGLEVNPDDYVSQFKPHLMTAVHAWCNGASFAKVTTLTDIFEGSIIRCMRRLEELSRQMIQAARGIGNKSLEDKFAEGIKMLKRDIVFAASLYL